VVYVNEASAKTGERAQFVRVEERNVSRNPSYPFIHNHP
jgi:hypothetical protein